MKTLTESAQAAKAIKQELKQIFPNTLFSVRSDNFSMGDAVRIHWTDGPTSKQVDEVVCKYQYGSFNGMEDIYENTNDRSDIPQAKYVQADRGRSNETELLIIEQIKKDYDPDFAIDKHYGHCWGSQLIWQRFNDMDLSVKTISEPKNEIKINGSFVIVDYSDKAVAVFGQTKAIKDQLKELGGRFNPYLTNEGQKQAGWVFPKTKKNDLESLLNNNVSHSEIITESITINPSESLRKKADSIRGQAEKLHTSVTQNWTYRRQNMADSQQHKQDNLIKLAVILEKLADKWDNNTIDENLKKIREKSDLEAVLHSSYPDKPTETNNWYAKEYPQRKNKIESLGIFSKDVFMQIRESLTLLSERELTQDEIKEKELSELIKKIHTANIPGFFPTPDKLIDQMIDLLDISEPVKNILEPSAGIGSICDKLEPLCTRLECCEIQYTLSEFLMKKGFNVVSNNIYDITGRKGYYDAIAMNPPFEKREDLKQIMFCFDLLNDSGKLISIISAGTMTEEFKNWLSDKVYEIYDTETGSFKGSFNSTGVSTKIILINK